jgi:hypothetical protein
MRRSTRPSLLSQLVSPALAFLANIRLGWKGLPRDKRPVRFGSVVVGDEEEKKFYNLDTWSYYLLLDDVLQDLW